MSDRAALLAAIKAFPEEDTPRLVFADWLDENGDERDRDWAALIRWGCAIGNRSSVFHVERNHATAFGWRFPSRVADGVYTLRRGFYEAFTGTAAAWLAHADSLLADHPVRRVTLRTLPDAQWVIDSWDMIREANLNPRSSMMRDACRARWPGIEFELPVHGTGGTVTVGGVSIPVTSWSVSGQPINPAAAPMPHAE